MRRENCLISRFVGDYAIPYFGLAAYNSCNKQIKTNNTNINNGIA